MITIKEMAKELGVSPTTVSNVINGRTEKMSEQTKLRIEEMLVKYHYVQDSRGGRNSQEELKLVVVEFFLKCGKGSLRIPSVQSFWSRLPENWKATGEAWCAAQFRVKKNF